MHKGTAARNAGRYSRQAREGPGGFVSEEAPLPTLEETIASYARAWARGDRRMDEIPAEFRDAVRRW